jgi:hypothetical protein
MPPKIKPDPHAFHDPALTARFARVERDRAQRVAALWACPILSDAEVPEVLHIPASTWQLRKKSADAPPIFSIGKRSYVRTAELLAWCERLRFVPKKSHGLTYPHAARQEAREINI